MSNQDKIESWRLPSFAPEHERNPDKCPICAAKKEPFVHWLLATCQKCKQTISIRVRPSSLGLAIQAARDSGYTHCECGGHLTFAPSE